MFKILTKVTNVVVGTDLWKNRKKEYFLALTAHFFDNNLNYRSIIYSFRQFKGLHFSAAIKPFIQKQLGPELIKKVKILVFKFLKQLMFILIRSFQ